MKKAGDQANGLKNIDPTEAYQASRRHINQHSVSVASTSQHNHSRAGVASEQKRMTQVTGITFNPESSSATPAGARGAAALNNQGAVAQMAAKGDYQALDQSSNSMQMGSQRPSAGGDTDGGVLMMSGAGTLGGLIDVRPKKLHSVAANENATAKKTTAGKTASKDNVQTVIGTEKIMIQSKPRGSDIASLESHQNKIASHRSRTKQGLMLSTQPKNKYRGGSDAEQELNSSDGNLAGDGVDGDKNGEQFEQESSYRQEKQSSTMKNTYISNKMQNIQQVTRTTKVASQGGSGTLEKSKTDLNDQKAQLTRSGFSSQQKFANNDINQHLSDASLNANLNSLDFSRLVIQLQSVLEFSREGDAADSFSLLRNFEQALGRNSNLNYTMFTVPLFQELFEHLLMHCKDHQGDLQNQSHVTVVEALMRVMHEFLLYRAKEATSLEADGSSHQPTSVSMYYLPGASAADPQQSTSMRPQDTIADSVIKRRDGSSPNRTQVIDPENATGTFEQKRGSNPDVNEIIVKIEMKKFQNLIENRIKHKNNLLQADMKRVYPLTKKTFAGGQTLYDQDRHEQQSPRKSKYGRSKKLNQSMQAETAQMSQAEAYGTDGGNTSGEDVPPGDKTIATDQQTISLFKKAETSKHVSQSIQGKMLSLEQSQEVVEAENQTDHGYENALPQSQLWFVNHKVTRPLPRKERSLRHQKRSMLPSVKVPQDRTSQDFNISRRNHAISYRQSLPSQPGGPVSHQDPVKSRNMLNLQNNSLNEGTFGGTNSTHQAPQSKAATHIRPLNMGQNRGKFNQLKSLLQSSERVQTSDDITMMRANKQVFFEASNKLQSQYGMTGNNVFQQRGKQFTAGGAYGGVAGAGAAASEETNSMNMSMDRAVLRSQQRQETTFQETVSAYADQNKLVSVEENDDLKALGGLDYVDSQITPELAISMREQKSREKSTAAGSVDVQRAFKNRVLQFKNMQQSSIVGNTSGVAELDQKSRSPKRNEESPSLDRDQQQSRHRLPNSSSSLEKGQTPMTTVNKLNIGLYSKLQYNANSLGKRFTHKSASRIQQQPSALGHSAVTHHPLFTRKDSATADLKTIGHQGAHQDGADGGKARENALNDSLPLPNKLDLSTEQGRHAKLLRSIIKPENPYSKMTDKDLLIFNPNYNAYLQKLKSKESKSSELSRIMSKPYDASRSKSRKDKKELVLYAYLRTQQQQPNTTANASKEALF